MISYHFRLDKYDWDVELILIVSKPDESYISNAMSRLRAKRGDLRHFLDIAEREVVNYGYTLSDGLKRASIVILGPSSSAEEFHDTFDHEKQHLLRHIIHYNDIDADSEEAAYLAGEIGRKMFILCKPFMCNDCRIGMIDYLKGVNR